ncbi:MAG TPA: hypothetical protein VGB77_07780 [Abditibacteriaceae bacterium]|jgi:hypothetical protein
MICLEVYLNGKRICVAGAGDSGFTIANIIVLPKRTGNVEGEGRLANLDVGGRANNEHLQWTDFDKSHLEIGDEVTIKIVESDTADEPIERKARKKT